MTSLTTAPPTIETLADLLEHLGHVPPSRIRFRPPPGTATERDVLEAERRDHRLCELVDGVLVEKAMGYREAFLAGSILTVLSGRSYMSCGQAEQPVGRGPDFRLGNPRA